MYMSFEKSHSIFARHGHALALVSMLLLAAGCQSLSAPALPPDVAANQIEVEPGVHLAGSINPDRIEALAASDALVIDLRTAKEGTEDEASSLRAAGVDYINLPTVGASIDPAAVATLTTLLDGRGNRPVVLHCRSGNRAGMLYAASRIAAGVDVESALAEVEGVVTVGAVSDAVRALTEAP